MTPQTARRPRQPQAGRAHGTSPYHAAEVSRPFLVVGSRPEVVRGVVLIAHGGKETSELPAKRWSLALGRMVLFARNLEHAGVEHGLLVAQLRYRVTGYNDGDPLRDVQWAIEELRREHSAPICLVGHSMGSRASLQAAGAEGVVGVAALAPWCPPTDPVDQLADRAVMMVHGLKDHITYPRFSHQFALWHVRLPHVCVALR